ncbi:unnamed protein product [Adineta steineri]|uniref:PH domain-containing protein n=1 Tax=Adineta steineri TaxID=433720 RepID=A0A818W2S1_9BILA|nr:unnamed protein product [Adineta steineri]CAF3719047.1 unnamed protein product [Adineta steineri]
MTDIVKAGWLQRRTTILKNWKREWFVLTRDARLRRMSSPQKHNEKADEVFELNRCREIRFGSEHIAKTIEPPTDSTREQLMEIVPGSGDTWTLCAESTDDLFAWQTSFDDVRQLYIERMQQLHARWTNTQIPPNRYNYTYYQNIYGDSSDSPRIYETSNGPAPRVIVVDRDPHYSRGGDAAAGVMTGMALGTLMLWPMFLFPLMWC